MCTHVNCSYRIIKADTKVNNDLLRATRVNKLQFENPFQNVFEDG